jgi:hypothetical protein
MTTIYLGGSHISYEDPRLSRLPKPAQEAAYFEQCEIRGSDARDARRGVHRIANALLVLRRRRQPLGSALCGQRTIIAAARPCGARRGGERNPFPFKTGRAA